MCPPLVQFHPVYLNQGVLDYTSKENQNTIIREWGEWILDGKNMTITHEAKQGKFNEKNSLWLILSKGLYRAVTKSFLNASLVQPSSIH